MQPHRANGSAQDAHLDPDVMRSWLSAHSEGEPPAIEESVRKLCEFVDSLASEFTGEARAEVAEFFRAIIGSIERPVHFSPDAVAGLSDADLSALSKNVQQYATRPRVYPFPADLPTELEANFAMFRMLRFTFASQALAQLRVNSNEKEQHLRRLTGIELEQRALASFLQDLGVSWQEIADVAREGSSQNAQKKWGRRKRPATRDTGDDG